MTRASLLSFAVALLCSLLLTPVAAWLASRWGILDHPDQRLKRHAQPVPYLGGVAVYLAFMVALVTVKIWQHGTVIGVVGMLTGASMIMALGVVDDLRALSPAVKFLGQTAAAAVLVVCNMRLQFIADPYLAAVVSVLWVVGVTNAMNLIDIMDGLSSGVAVIAAVWFYAVSAGSGRYNTVLILAALAGAALGFLPYNFPKARIYLGDAGALLLGFVLASVAMGQGYSRINTIAVLAPLLILAVPIFDTLFIMFLRHRRGVSMFRGSPDHLALRLVKLGLTRTQTVGLLWGAAAALGGAAYLSTRLPFTWALLIYVAAGVLALFVAERVGSFPMEAKR